MSDSKPPRGPYGAGWSDSPRTMPPGHSGLLRRMHRWSKRHPVLDGMALGPLTLLGLLVWRGLGIPDLSLTTCLMIGLVATVLGACAGLNNRRRNRRRLERGDPESPFLVLIGLSDSGERPPLIGRVVLPAVCLMAVIVGGASALIIDGRSAG